MLKFDWSRLVYDITYTSIGAAVVEDFDDGAWYSCASALKGAAEKNPLWTGRAVSCGWSISIQDPDNSGANICSPDCCKSSLFLQIAEGKTSLETMLQRWYQLEKEYRNQTAG